MNRLITYFDLVSEYRPRGPRAIAAGSSTVTLHWIPQYVALLLGILIQPFFQGYMKTGQWSFNGFWGWLFASLIMALMAFPGVYKSSFDGTKHIVAQFCVIFTAGTGWQTLVSTAFKAAGVTNS
jgi:hypothetical protein